MQYTSVAAPLLAFVLLTLSWWALAQWNKDRHLFFLLFSFFNLAASVIGFWAIYVIPYAWIVGLVIIAAIYAFLIPSGIQRLTKTERPWFTGFSRVGFLLVLIIAAAGIAVFRYQQDTSNKTLASQTTAAKTLLIGQTDLENSLTSLLADPAIQTAPTSNQALSLLQKYIVNDKLGFLTLTDASGQVVARTSNPLWKGDPLLREFSWLSPLQEHKKVEGVALDENGLPVSVIAQEITQDQKVVGFLEIGIYLDQQHLAKLVSQKGGNWAIADAVHITAGATEDSSLRTVWQSKDIDALVTASALKTSTLSIQGKAYYLTAAPFSSLDGSRLTLLNLSHVPAL